MHSDPQARPYLAAAGQIRKLSPGHARAQELIEVADKVAHRTGSFAAAMGCLQADVHKLCDELAALQTPALPHVAVTLQGVSWQVEACNFCQFTGELEDLNVWVNGDWLNPRTVFGPSFAAALIDAYHAEYPAQRPDAGPDVEDGPTPGCAFAAETAWAQQRDAGATQ